jgi:hypothetical protein
LTWSGRTGAAESDMLYIYIDIKRGVKGVGRANGIQKNEI